MTRTVRPDWVKPGGQWSAGQTFEEYEATGQPVNPSYPSPTTQPPADQPTLESISAGIAGVAAQVPGIQAGVEAISAQDLTDGAGAIQPVSPTDTTAGGAGAAITSSSGVDTMMQSMLNQISTTQEQLTQANEQQQTWMQTLLGQGGQSQADILAQQQELFGVQEMFQQIQDITNLTLPLTQQVADLTTQETAEIENARGLGMSEGWMTRKETDIHNKYNRLKAPIATQLNAYAAQTQALQGNLSIANQFATQAVNAATYDQEFEYNQIKDFMSINQGFIDTLKADERFYFTNALDLAKDSLNIARDDANYVMELQMQSGGQAGINPTDTRQQAQAKFANWSGQQPTEFEAWKQKVDYEAGIATDSTLRNWTDFEIKASMSNLMAQQLTLNPDAKPEDMYVEAIQEIDADDSVGNKAYAKEVAAAIYGVTSPTAKAKAEADAKAAATKAAKPKTYPYIDPVSGKLITSEKERTKIEKENKENADRENFGRVLSPTTQNYGSSPLTISGNDLGAGAFFNNIFNQ